LIIISAILVTKEIKQWGAGVIISGLVGIAIAFYVTVATPVDTPNYPWLIFVSGAIAICAMILPGISGAFLLLIMGKYEFILDALRSLDFEAILSFSHVITFLLKKYHHLTIALLAGFMVGSLNKIWPWKAVTAYRIDSHGMEVPFLDKNVFPGAFQEITGQNPLVFQALLFLLMGIGLIYFIEKIAERYNKNLAQN
jgi:putative membrane protein